MTDGYFDNVGLRMVSGRDFSAEDRQPDVRSSIINETMARWFFPQGDAVGKRWSYGDAIDATFHLHHLAHAHNELTSENHLGGQDARSMAEKNKEA